MSFAVECFVCGTELKNGWLHKKGWKQLWLSNFHCEKRCLGSVRTMKFIWLACAVITFPLKCFAWTAYWFDLRLRFWESLFTHNRAADWARDLFKHSKDAESLVVSIQIILGNFGFELFCGWNYNWGRFRVVLAHVVDPAPKLQKMIFYYKRKTSKKYASLEHTIGFLAFVFRKSVPQKRKSIN